MLQLLMIFMKENRLLNHFDFDGLENQMEGKFQTRTF